MTPIGGGYETDTLRGFAEVAMRGASGPTVDLVVVPAAYGDAPADRAENLALAQERTDQVDAACDAAVRAPFTGCTATLLPILNREDALVDASSAAITAQTDGIFILGGDQGLAMSILAGTPAEQRISLAYKAGANIGGTSAGAAVESRTMINGYSGEDVYPWDGLQRGSSLMWWGDDADAERGLQVGSQAAIYDQHFYQRGRFGRLLSTVAESDTRFAGASRLGVGVDYATGVRNTNDATLSDVFGASSVAIIDMEGAGTSTPAWVGPSSLLSVRDVTTHLMPPGPVRFDLASRTLTLNGTRFTSPTAAPWVGPSAPDAQGTVLLGGDVLGRGDAAVLAEVVRLAAASGPGAAGAPIAVVTPDSSDLGAARQYATALTSAGWVGGIEVVVKGDKALTAQRQLAGVVFVGESPKSVSKALGNKKFREAATALALRTPVVLADRHMAAAFGPWWSLKADPTSENYEDEAIANFRTGDGNWQRGLGIVTQSVVPSLGYDYRWGKLYDHGQLAPQTIVHGVDLDTALRVTADPAGAGVVGSGSVVSLNPRHATWWTGPNGAIGVHDARLSVWAPGESVTGGR